MILFLIYGVINFDVFYYLSYVNYGRGGREEEELEVQYMTEEYKMMFLLIRTEEIIGSFSDSGYGIIFVVFIGRF